MPPFSPWNSVDGNEANERSLLTPLRRNINRSLKSTKEQLASNRLTSVTSHGGNNDITYDDAPYDFHPFTTKNTITESKMKHLLGAETAEHCLIFHNEGHPNGSEGYRPDIMLDCEPKSSKDADILINYSENVADSYRGIQSSKQQSGKNVELVSRNRGSIHKPATKLLELKVFWENSDLLNYLETDMIIRQNQILLNELEELTNVKKQLKTKRHNTSLTERCNKILNHR
ncbi:hypothetical protein C6P45_001734 [Maudiozyma exigua]|uniref:Uncharacterized protein n=1 Tax=Maudiozyma exigua TaxID=34358 RepID=A0A9P7B518_MAUEX|nr:hypothetical protein C6P45_001734 [Kazachstania exigua]